MKKIIISEIASILLVLCGTSLAQVVPLPVPITAEQAFDAVQTQADPSTGAETSVALIDVRSRAEYFWVGAACQVDNMITKEGEVIAPDYGKVLLTNNGKFLNFEINGLNKRLQVNKVSSINLSPIAINIPYELWDEGTGTLIQNSDFSDQVEALEGQFDVLIFFCRSGGRSQSCLAGFNSELFDAIYEIDQPDGASGYGGFEGSSYSNVYNGFRGFPERLTEIQTHPSVSWKDTGLPIKTSVNPLSNP